MNIINDIYIRRVHEENIVQSEKQIDEELFAMMQRLGYDRDDDRMADILFKASDYGQQYGYRAGFQTAVLLMMECFT